MHHGDHQHGPLTLLVTSSKSLTDDFELRLIGGPKSAFEPLCLRAGTPSEDKHFSEIELRIAIATEGIADCVFDSLGPN